MKNLQKKTETNIMKHYMPKKSVKSILYSLFILIILVSCAGFQLTQPLLEEVERPERPAIPEMIMGQGIIPATDMAVFLLNANPELCPDFARDLSAYYVEEAAIEGINHDVAFAQMVLETGHLRFGGLVTSDMNNFAGLGSTGPGNPGLSFPEPRIGVRAQVQHLKAYASDEPLNQLLVNPRYFLVNLGSSPSIRGLAGTWAADPQYAEKIFAVLERLYVFSFGY